MTSKTKSYKNKVRFTPFQMKNQWPFYRLPSYKFSGNTVLAQQPDKCWFSHILCRLFYFEKILNLCYLVACRLMSFVLVVLFLLIKSQQNFSQILIVSFIFLDFHPYIKKMENNPLYLYCYELFMHLPRIHILTY